MVRKDEKEAAEGVGEDCDVFNCNYYKDGKCICVTGCMMAWMRQGYFASHDMST